MAWLSLRSKWAAGPAAAGREERSIFESIRDRRATQPPAHFHRNPPGRGQLAVFLRCSLLTYQFRYARRSRLEKQPTDPAAAGRKPCYLWDRTRALVAFSAFEDLVGKTQSGSVKTMITTARIKIG